jgi:hypothetical protein
VKRRGIPTQHLHRPAAEKRGNVMQKFPLFSNRAYGNPNGKDFQQAQHVINTHIEYIQDASIINPPTQISYGSLGKVTKDFPFEYEGKKYEAKEGDIVRYNVN